MGLSLVDNTWVVGEKKTTTMREWRGKEMTTQGIEREGNTIGMEREEHKESGEVK